MNISIRRQVVLITVVSIVLLLLFLPIYFISYSGVLHRQQQEIFQTDSDSIANKISAQLSSVGRVAFTLATSNTIQQYLYSDDLLAQYSAVETIRGLFEFPISSGFCRYGLLRKQDVTQISSSNYSFTVNNYLTLEEYLSEFLPARITSKDAMVSGFLPGPDGSGIPEMYAYVLPVSQHITGYSQVQQINGLIILLCDPDKLVGQESEQISWWITYNDPAGGESSVYRTPLDVESDKNEYLHKETAIPGAANWTLHTASVRLQPKNLFGSDSLWVLLGLSIGTMTLLAMGWSLYLNISRPVSRLTASIERIQSSGVYANLEVPYHNEIGTLSKSFDMLLRRVENMNLSLLETQRELFEMEIARHRAELQFFQNQINPHFLYNTLECIRSMADYYEIRDIAEISAASAKIFRYACKEGSMVFIQDEIDVIRDYLIVMSKRYMKDTSVICNIPEEFREIRIPKMILQPIVENSIRHGWITSEGVWKVEIDITEAVECLPGTQGRVAELSIRDNGTGMDVQQVQALNDSFVDPPGEGEIDLEYKAERGIGLINIHNRIRMCFGDHYGLSVKSEPGEGTTVRLRLPYQT